MTSEQDHHMALLLRDLEMRLQLGSPTNVGSVAPSEPAVLANESTEDRPSLEQLNSEIDALQKKIK